jgi:hypothetical protein
MHETKNECCNVPTLFFDGNSLHISVHAYNILLTYFNHLVFIRRGKLFGSILWLRTLYLFRRYPIFKSLILPVCYTRYFSLCNHTAFTILIRMFRRRMATCSLTTFELILVILLSRCVFWWYVWWSIYFAKYKFWFFKIQKFALR